MNFLVSSYILLHRIILRHISDLCTRVSLMGKGKIIQDFKNSLETMKGIEDYFHKLSEM